MTDEYQNFLRRLSDSTALLGPCTPLPTLFEEVLRVWRGLAVNSERMRRATLLLREISHLPEWQTQLYALLRDEQASRESRLLAATLLTMPHAGAERPPLAETDDPLLSTLLAMAYFTGDGATGWYLRQLHRWLKKPTLIPERPALLPLLCFLKGLSAEALPAPLFDAAVLQAEVLHPRVAAHRPFRRLHRLLDYLGLSDALPVQQHYRRLVAEIWPSASVENYSEWQWVTVPGGPECLPEVITALHAEEWTLPHLHALKYLPLPKAERLADYLAVLPLQLQQLLLWLRPEIERFTTLSGGEPAQHWLRASNQIATDAVYANADWWAVWRQEGWPVAREVLQRLQALPLPPASPDIPQDRHQWLEAHYLPHYRQIVANMLLAQAAEGESLPLLLQMAAAGELPAVRSLALCPEIVPAIIDTLRPLVSQGNRPLQAAARQALEHLAHRQGLPGVDELQRQSLLAVAWEAGPLQGERVRVLWEEGGYRLRLALQRGKVELQVLGARGPITAVPDAVRRGAAYRQAREAQRQAQAQYRLFKQSLETDMLASRPLALGEFTFLLANPIFAHLAERLVWQTSQGNTILWSGPERWETCDGTPVDFRVGEHALLFMQVAHPVLLVQAHTLVAWQALAMDRRLVQPFKQLFREVYLAGDHPETVCARFAGRAIDPRRAYALLRAAGFAPAAGIAQRAWPHGLNARLCWAADAAGHDLFGAQRKDAVQTGDIWFTRNGASCAPADVDAIAFSETLRAADLLTTRAAVGDAELTSRETVALRVTLLREVARAFALTNIAVREEGGYALVLGAHATYRVNLANGVVLFEPEGRQLHLPQLDQHWQPSEEDVDTTSRILDLVLMLARDDAIDDLTFLAQLSPG